MPIGNKKSKKRANCAPSSAKLPKTVKRKQTVSPTPKKNKPNRFINTLLIGKHFTEAKDNDFSKYENNKVFKQLVKKNPTLYVVNMIYVDTFKKSLFKQLVEPKHSDFANALSYCFKLSTIVGTKSSEEKYPIVTLLNKQGFNTIYDILLENKESFFLSGFVSHLASENIIDKPNDFIKYLNNNKLHDELRSNEIVIGLQLSDLYTRIKRYQYKN